MAKKLKKPGGWLFKEEPSCYSYADLERDGTTMWAGVKNALARQHLRAVRAGDRVLYYHTGAERAIVGEMQVVADAIADPKSEDPKAVLVHVSAVRRWDPPVTLSEIREDPLFADWDLVRNSRLSVMPVSEVQWIRLEEICRLNAKGQETA